MDEKHIFYSHKGSITTITLNRPDAKNAFSTEMIGLSDACLKEAKKDDSVRVIVITGNGDTFCSGGDIKDMVEVYGRNNKAGKKDRQ